MEINNTFNTNYAQSYALNEQKANGTENDAKNSVEKSDTSNKTSDNKENQKGQKAPNELSEAERRVVSELAATDAHVRAHEAAHMGAGGGLTSPASYTYERGPDNKMYAVAGEVGISAGEGKTPEETLGKAQQIRRAALAPSDPSPQDLKVAARASSMEMNARAQIMSQKVEEQNARNKEKQDKQNADKSTNDGSNDKANSSVNSSFGENSSVKNSSNSSSNSSFRISNSSGTSVDISGLINSIGKNFF